MKLFILLTYLLYVVAQSSNRFSPDTVGLQNVCLLTHCEYNVTGVGDPAEVCSRWLSLQHILYSAFESNVTSKENLVSILVCISLFIHAILINDAKLQGVVPCCLLTGKFILILLESPGINLLHCCWLLVLKCHIFCASILDIRNTTTGAMRLYLILKKPTKWAWVILCPYIYVLSVPNIVLTLCFFEAQFCP